MKYFGTAGIRGVFNKEIKGEFVLKIGHIISILSEKRRVAIARDYRTGSIPLYEILKGVFLSREMELHELDVVPTPILAYYTKKNHMDFGIMITASHNPPEYSGIKIFMKKGRELNVKEEEEIEKLLDQNITSEYSYLTSGRKISMQDTATDQYVNNVIKTVPKTGKTLKVLVDCSNGPVGPIVKRILSILEHETFFLNCNPDPRFPAHSPEPSPENLSETSMILKKVGVDVGLVYDGDGDRILFIDEKGGIIDVHTTNATYLKYRLREGGKAIISIDSSRSLINVVTEKKSSYKFGKLGKIFMYIEEWNADIGVEPWKIIDTKWGLWEDAIFSSTMILQYISNYLGNTSEFFRQVPRYYNIRKNYKLENKEDSLKIISRIDKEIRKNAERIFSIDGFRYEFPDKSWLLVRPSGTENKLRVYIEAEKKRRANYLLNKIEDLIWIS